MKTESTEPDTPLAQERRDVTGGTHDGTAGPGRGRSGANPKARRWVGLAFILSRAEWQNLVRGGYEAEFQKGTFVFFCRCLSLSRRAGELEPPSIDEDAHLSLDGSMISLDAMARFRDPRRNRGGVKGGS